MCLIPDMNVFAVVQTDAATMILATPPRRLLRQSSSVKIEDQERHRDCISTSYSFCSPLAGHILWTNLIIIVVVIIIIIIIIYSPTGARQHIQITLAGAAL